MPGLSCFFVLSESLSHRPRPICWRLLGGVPVLHTRAPPRPERHWTSRAEGAQGRGITVWPSRAIQPQAAAAMCRCCEETLRQGQRAGKMPHTQRCPAGSSIYVVTDLVTAGRLDPLAPTSPSAMSPVAAGASGTRPTPGPSWQWLESGSPNYAFGSSEPSRNSPSSARCSLPGGWPDGKGGERLRPREGQPLDGVGPQPGRGALVLLGTQSFGDKILDAVTSSMGRIADARPRRSPRRRGRWPSPLVGARVARARDPD
jgi:hypothetical protein